MKKNPLLEQSLNFAKECAETEYWIRLLEKSDYINSKYAENLLVKCLSLKKMLISSLNTVKSNI